MLKLLLSSEEEISILRTNLPLFSSLVIPTEEEVNEYSYYTIMGWYEAHKQPTEYSHDLAMNYFNNCKKIEAPIYCFLHQNKLYPVHVIDIISLNTHGNVCDPSQYVHGLFTDYIALIKVSPEVAKIIKEDKPSYKIKNITLFAYHPELDSYKEAIIERNGLYHIEKFKIYNPKDKPAKDWKWNIDIEKMYLNYRYRNKRHY